MQWYNGNANLRPAAAPPPQLKIPAPGVISIICIISVCWLLSATQSRSAAVQFHIKLMQQVKLYSQELEPWMEALENIKIVSKICLYAHVTSVLFCSNSCKTRNMLDVHTWSFTGHLTLCTWDVTNLLEVCVVGIQMAVQIDGLGPVLEEDVTSGVAHWKRVKMFYSVHPHTLCSQNLVFLHGGQMREKMDG